MFVDVGPIEDLAEGVTKILSVKGRDLGIVRWRGAVYALRNVCPHQHAPVCAGAAMPMLVDDGVDGIAVAEDKLVIVCPWHSWEFEVSTGRSAWGPSRYKLKTYAVKVVEGRVLVDVGGAGEA